MQIFCRRGLKSVLIMVFLGVKLFAGNLEEQIQQLQNRINDELLGLKKEFPQSQPVVYSVLDQVCKLYKISQDSIDQESKLKTSLNEMTTELRFLKAENGTLKGDLKKIKDEFELTNKNFAQASRQMEQKDLMLAFLAKEKQKLTTEKNKLAEEKNRLATEKEDLVSKTNKLNTAQNSDFQELQSLSLTSTSEPISPR